MKNHAVNRIVASLLPLGAVVSSAQVMGAYSYLGNGRQNTPVIIEASGSSQVKQLDNLSSYFNLTKVDELTIHRVNHLSEPKHEKISDEITIIQANAVSELIIIDQNVPDKSVFYRQLKPGIDVAEISSDDNGLDQLNSILSNYQNLNALHLVSHAKDGALLLGNSTVTSDLLKQELSILATLDGALKDQADLLLYGCELAKTEKGEQLLELIASTSHVDVAASNDVTGNPSEGGDWELEISKGDIETELPFSEVALRDFTALLGIVGGNGTIDMTGIPAGYSASISYATGGYTVRFDTDTAGTEDLQGYPGSGGYIIVDPYGDRNLKKMYAYFTGGETFDATSVQIYNQAGGAVTFQFSSDINAPITEEILTSSTEVVTLAGFTGITKLTIEVSGGADLTLIQLDDLVVANVSAPTPTVTSATYDFSNGDLVVTGTNFTGNGGGDDVDASTITITGENGDTYTLTDTADVNRDSNTQFTLDLSATDETAVNAIINKDGTTATGGGTYNVAVSDDFITAETAGDTSDATNALTVSNVAKPVISSATYDGSTGVFAFTGTYIPYITGATNDVDASLFTFNGEGNATYTLVGSSDVEIASATSFSITLDATDKAEVQKLINKAGLTATGGATYNIAAAEDWSAGADVAVNVVDGTTGVTVSNVPAPTITSATYAEGTNQLVVTGSNFVALSGASNDIDVTKLTITGEGGGTFTLTGQTSNVEITSITAFTVNVGGTDIASVEDLLNLNGTASGSGTTYNLDVADDFNAGNTDGDTSDATNAITVSGWAPSITSATYDFSTGDLVVTGIDFTAKAGAANDIDASAFTVTGEGGATYTLTDTDDVERTSLTSFTLDLSATDEAGVNAIINKDGTVSTGTTTYNLAAADDFVATVTAGDISDLTANGITVSNVTKPVITSATYDGATGIFVLTGTDVPSLTGATNDIDASLFTFNGEGNVTYTLVGSSDVERTSSTSFSITLDATDKAEVQKLINKAGLTATGGATYNIAAAEDWSKGADVAVNVVDAISAVTVSNVPVPTVTSATYDTSTNTLVVTGTNFVALSGASNDIDVSTLTFTGEGGGTYTLTVASSDVEIDSATQFTVILGGADITSIEALLNINGATADSGTTYNLAVADDFNAGNTDGDTSDTTLNAITVSGVPSPSITSATYNASTGTLVVTGVDFAANGGGFDVDASMLTFTGEDSVSYALTDTADVNRDSVTQFSLILSVTDKAGVNAITNKDGTTATGGATYNIGVADNFITAVMGGDTSDATGNGITISNVAPPTITSATYNGTTGIFAVTGTDIPNITGANNDIDASLFTFTGEGGVSYTLVGTSDVERSSVNGFNLTLDATDKAEVQKLINKAGLTATGGATYNIAAAEDWSTGADAAVNVVDAAGNGVTVSNVPIPAITSATYNEDSKALIVTGVNFVALSGAGNDIDITKLTVTGEGGGTHTLTAGQTSDVEITGVTSFSVTVAGTDVANVEALLNVNGTQSNNSTTYNLGVTDDFNAGNTDGDTSDSTNGITVSGWPQPTVTSTVYDAVTGTLVVTGVDFAANGGGADVDASTITFTGGDGTSYTLTDTSDVEIDSATQFTITLSATDSAAVNAIINNNGANATGGGAYNVAFADDFMTVVTIGNTSDTTGNAVTVSNVAIPVITSTTYNATTGVLVATGSGIPNLTGTSNDIDASMFTFTGEGGTYTLVATSDVERSSATSFSLTLDATDKAEVQKLANKDGLTSTNGTTYNIGAAEDWAKGANVTVDVIDGTSSMAVSNMPVPAINSVTYNSNTGTIVVTGTGFLQLTGATNDIDLSTLTFTGEAGGNYTLTTVTDVEITNGTSFSATLAGADKTAVDLLLHINGTQSDDATVYNLSAAEDWNKGADVAVNIVDSSASITVSGWPIPTLTSATYDASTGALVVTGTNLFANGGGFDIDASKLILTGEGDTSYTLTDTTDVNHDSLTQFTLTLSSTDIAGANAVINNNGLTPTGVGTYNITAADDFNTVTTIGDTADTGANAITVSNVPIATILSATYDVLAGSLVVTGTDIPNHGSNSDIDVSMFTFTGEGGSYTLIASSDVERSSSTSFTIILDTTDRAAVELLMDRAGIVSSSGVVYNITAAEDWATGSALSVNIVDNTNAITASNLPNSSPVIQEGMVTTVSMSQNASPTAFSLTLNASDTDNDLLSWAISSSATHGTASVTGTGSSKVINYTPDTNYNGTDSFSVSVNDGNGGTDSISVAIAIEAPANVAPIALAQSLTTEEDKPLTIQVSATDGDLDTLSYRVVTQPSNGVLVSASSNLTYTPNANFNGNDSFSFVANDGVTDSAAADVLIAVTAVNDTPVAVDDVMILEYSELSSYNIDVVANDSDIDGDTLSIVSASTTIGSVTVESNQLVYQYSGGLQGGVQLSYVIDDGSGGENSHANALVTLLIESNNDALLPTITLPDDIETNANALYTKIDLGVATAIDKNGQVVPVSLIDGISMFEPGNNLAYWKAIDEDGLDQIATQKVKVHPLITIDKDAQGVEGQQYSVGVYLNGTAPDYPVIIPYTVSGSADDSDHLLTSGDLIINQGVEGVISIETLTDNIDEEAETVVITLGSEFNLGAKSVFTLTIIEGNIAPELSYSVTQNDESRLLIESNGGEVVIQSAVVDANINDTHSYLWESIGGELSDIDNSEDHFTFSTTDLANGIYKVALSVTDDGAPAQTTSTTVYLEVTEALATLTDIDSDGDLIPDNQEGFGDEDLDGIPDYLDATHPCNVMPEQVEDTQIFLVEGDSGVCLRKGLTVANNEMGSIQLEDTEVSIDGEYENMGGIFDFVAYGLPLAGQTYNLVLPQRLPIPEGAVYRKYRVDSGWVDFVIDSNNYYSSSPGELGFCPPPGDVSWVKGLQQGDWCVQVTIEDGGPNDDDGEANNTIIDPSGVAVPLTTNKKPVVNDQQITMGWNSSITIDVLSNATDEDGDTLTISSANVDFGDVLIESDQLVYTPAESFFGEAVIHFGVNDNNGGTAYSTVTVDVIENQAPVAVDDEVSTDDRSTIEIDVLVNDSDIDGGLLTVLNATAQYGEVIVNENNMLIYTALLGYDGVDMIDYTISDEYDSLTSGQVRVSVTAYKEVVVTNKSSGSLGCLALLLGVLAIVFRYVRTNKLSRLMTVFIPLMVISLQSQAQWELNSKLGQSTVSDSSSIKSEYPDSKISQLDDSDLSWSFGINFRFDNNLRVGVQYINMGDAGVTITSDSLIPSQNHNAVADAGPMLVDGFALESGYRFWQAKYIEGEVFAGVLSWSGDFDSEYDGNTLSTSKNGTDIYYGVAAYYPLAPNWSLGLGYQRFNLSVNDVDMFYISVNYQY